MRRLTRNDIVEGEPFWSPQGRTVVFEAAPDSEVFILSSRRATPRQLTDNDASDGAIAWSPVGRVAFASGRGGRHGIYLMRPDGTGQRRLMRAASPTQTLEWSPSGTELLAVTGAGAMTIDLRDGSARRLARGVSAATWSPNGQAIAYVLGKSLFVVGTNARDRRRVSTISRFEGDEYGWGHVDWSSSGAIAYTVEGRHEFALRVVSASGKVLRDLTGSEPTWSPNGRRLAYRGGGIWVFQPRHGSPRRLHAERYAYSPSWTRDGETIVFRGEDGIWQLPVAGGSPIRVLLEEQVGELAVR